MASKRAPRILKRKNPSPSPIERRTSWVAIYPAPDVEGSWIGHMLDLDVVSVGDSIEHALQMVLEATALCVQWDIDKGKNPFVVRKPAPAAEYRKVKRAVFEGTFAPNLKAALDAADDEMPDLVVTQIHVFLRRDLREADVKITNVFAA